MGVHDSSSTRVVPVFDTMYAADPTGSRWLSRLLRLPTGGQPFQVPPDCSYVIRKAGWGHKKNGRPLEEEKLPAPVSLLSWIINHPRKPVSGNLSSDPSVAKKRQEWIAGSKDRIDEGIRLLQHNPTGEMWHLFEGESQPDVFIETDNLVVVIEGKRTERHPTTTTKWMAGRHQMLRHIDCAWERRKGKSVFGFFIVEGIGDSCDVPAAWLGFAKGTISPEAVTSSLPHRSQAEQEGISSCFIGVTTWQRVCHDFADFGLKWSDLPDTDRAASP